MVAYFHDLSVYDVSFAVYWVQLCALIKTLKRYILHLDDVTSCLEFSDCKPLIFIVANFHEFCQVKIFMAISFHGF